ncbi:MAG TPA: class I fructose-bisphosphate aldolase [Candidatus Paceibacterota bacterium]|nr:class I fructose-bisphosphate aldolase [Candidatus Paceibacterota bacterium]
MIDLSDIARQLVAPGKGLLAADESTASADKRLIQYGITPSVEARRKYRDLFLATPGIEAYISGVILYQETLDQAADDGTPFPELLASRGIIPGIKVDEGTEPFPESKDELITKGLIGLPERLQKFSRYGTGFTKWRAVIRIKGDMLPTGTALLENAKRLAQYARDVQQAGMVPILEPEVLLEGPHSRVRSREVLVKTLETLMATLQDHAVDFSGIILKTAMAVSGSESGRTDSPEEVAEDTLAALLETVPSSVPGIVFLSGGQTPDQATENLRAISRKAREVHAPWPLTFSYARAIQGEALTVWGGNDEAIPQAREAYLERLKKVADALGA